MRQHEEQMNNKSMNASREGVAPERPGGDEWEGEEGDQGAWNDGIHPH